MDIDLEAPAMLIEGIEVRRTTNSLREAILAASELPADRFAQIAIIVGETGIRLGPEQIRAIAAGQDLHPSSDAA